MLDYEATQKLDFDLRILLLVFVIGFLLFVRLVQFLVNAVAAANDSDDGVLVDEYVAAGYTGGSAPGYGGGYGTASLLRSMRSAQRKRDSLGTYELYGSGSNSGIGICLADKRGALGGLTGPHHSGGGAGMGEESSLSSSAAINPSFKRILSRQCAEIAFAGLMLHVCNHLGLIKWLSDRFIGQTVGESEETAMLRRMGEPLHLARTPLDSFIRTAQVAITFFLILYVLAALFLTLYTARTERKWQAAEVAARQSDTRQTLTSHKLPPYYSGGENMFSHSIDSRSIDSTAASVESKEDRVFRSERHLFLSKIHRELYPLSHHQTSTYDQFSYGLYRKDCLRNVVASVIRCSSALYLLGFCIFGTAFAYRFVMATNAGCERPSRPSDFLVCKIMISRAGELLLTALITIICLLATLLLVNYKMAEAKASSAAAAASSSAAAIPAAANATAASRLYLLRSAPFTLSFFRLLFFATIATLAAVLTNVMKPPLHLPAVTGRPRPRVPAWIAHTFVPGQLVLLLLVAFPSCAVAHAVTATSIASGARVSTAVVERQRLDRLHAQSQRLAAVALALRTAAEESLCASLERLEEEAGVGIGGGGGEGMRRKLKEQKRREYAFLQAVLASMPQRTLEDLKLLHAHFAGGADAATIIHRFNLPRPVFNRLRSGLLSETEFIAAIIEAAYGGVKSRALREGGRGVGGGSVNSFEEEEEEGLYALGSGANSRSDSASKSGSTTKTGSKSESGSGSGSASILGSKSGEKINVRKRNELGGGVDEGGGRGEGRAGKERRDSTETLTQRAFALLDVDRDGRVNIEDFQRVLDQRLDPPLTRTEGLVVMSLAVGYPLPPMPAIDFAAVNRFLTVYDRTNF